MTSRSSGSCAGRFVARVALTAGVIGLLALGGCSSSEPPVPAEQTALAKTELHFDINKCQSISPGLYKCPATDQPICSPDYNGQQQCVRIGPKGSVFIQSGFNN